MSHQPTAFRAVMVDRVPDGEAQYAHYEHRRVPGSAEFVDVRAIALRHATDWSSQLVRWHQELGEIAAAETPYWWLTRGSRLHAWHADEIKPLFFALAVREHGARQAGARPLFLLGCPQAVGEFLREWDVPVDDARVTRPRTLLRFLPAIVPKFRAGLLGLRPLLRWRPCGAVSVEERVLIVSNALDARRLREHHDHFFGSMLDQSMQASRVVWMYFVTRRSDEAAVRQFCAEVARPVTFPSEHLRPRDLIAATWLAFRTAFRLVRVQDNLPVLAIAGVTSIRFPQRYFRSLVAWELPAAECAVLIAFRRLRGVGRCLSVLYPYEEKGVERAMILALRALDPAPRVVAFAHAVYNRGHYYVGPSNGPLPPRPDLLLAPGPRAARWLRERTSIPQVVAVGSPRYLDPPSRAEQRSPAAPMRVLFLVGYGYELSMLANFVEQVPDLFDGCELAVRRYPYAWEAEQTRAAHRLERLLPAARLQSGDLDQEISQADVVLFCSTSAGFHAMLRHALVLQVGLYDLVRASPLDGYDDEGVVPSFDTPEDLKAGLRHIAALPRDQVRRIQERQRAFAAEVYAKPDPSRLEEVVV